jgi:hypothetical protein
MGCPFAGLEITKFPGAIVFRHASVGTVASVLPKGRLNRFGASAV